MQDMAFLVIIDLLDKGLVQLFGIFELFFLLYSKVQFFETLIRTFYSFLQGLGPCQFLYDGRQMVVDWCLGLWLRDNVLAFDIDSPNSLQILFEFLDQLDDPFFDLLLDQWSLQHSIKEFQNLEPVDQVLGIIQGLDDYSGHPSLQLFDFLSEDIKLVFELFLIGVHNVVAKTGEGLAGHDELIVDLLDGFGQVSTLGASDLAEFKLVELHDGRCDMVYVVAAFCKVVQGDE
jgi:hypothetical protein